MRCVKSMVMKWILYYDNTESFRTPQPSYAPRISTDRQYIDIGALWFVSFRRAVLWMNTYEGLFCDSHLSEYMSENTISLFFTFWNYDLKFKEIHRHKSHKENNKLREMFHWIFLGVAFLLNQLVFLFGKTGDHLKGLSINDVRKMERW